MTNIEMAAYHAQIETARQLERIANALVALVNRNNETETEK